MTAPGQRSGAAALYGAYGLHLFSEIALPELPRSPEAGAPPDATIALGTVAAGGLAEGTQLGPFLWTGDSTLWLDVPGVARFLVEDGRRITIDPAPGIDADSIRVFLLGSALGALLFQRGFLVMHGNAVRIGDACLLCVGPSGAGKSTLATAFLRRGYDVLADDVVPVDDAGRAVPGFPRIKLWQDAADRFGIDTARLARIRPGLEKFNLPVPGRRSQAPLPVRWVYVLESDNEEGIRFEPIQGMQRFSALRDNTYRLRYIDGMAMKGDHLRRCAALSSQIRLSLLRRGRSGSDPDAMIDAILQDIGENG